MEEDRIKSFSMRIPIAGITIYGLLVYFYLKDMIKESSLRIIFLSFAFIFLLLTYVYFKRALLLKEEKNENKEKKINRIEKRKINEILILLINIINFLFYIFGAYGIFLYKNTL